MVRILKQGETQAQRELKHQKTKICPNVDFLKLQRSSRISSELECEVCLFADHCTGELCLK